MATCPSCGSTLVPHAKFCSVCGTRNLSASGSPQGSGSSQGGGRTSPNPTSLTPAAPSTMPGAFLIAKQGGAQHRVSDQMTIGRDPACTLCLDVDDISRRHATIIAQPAGWAIVDQGSRNGTFVNGAQALATTPVFHLDLILFGTHTEFGFYDPLHPRPHSAAGLLPPTATIPPLPPTTGLVPPAAPNSSLQPAGPTRYQWPKTPQVEGHVLSMHGPVMTDRDGKIGKALLSVGLGLISPALVFLPWAMSKNQIAITQMRVEDIDTQRHVAVTLLGDLRTSIQDGDFIAVWGRLDQGTLYAVDLFNYQTGAMIRFKP